ncbi:MAG: hypothetical protein RMI39_07105 [Thermoanaerobaculum sp.]|nr:hypothetical protein [Thermoanaerobaculum sp.]
MRRRSLAAWLLLWTFLLSSWAILHGFWRRQVGNLTGEARWVWVTQQLERPYPTRAVFVAPFSLPEPRPGVLLKVAADREYVAWVNGVLAACGWSRPGFRLDVYDVSHLVRPGRNALRLEVRSPTPVGGVLAAVDLPGVGKNALITGRDFFLEERSSLVPPPVVWGPPPRYPWGYPRLLSRPRTLDQLLVADPINVGPPRQVQGHTYLYQLDPPVFGYLWLIPDGAGWVWYAVGGGGEDLGPLRERFQVHIGAPKRSWIQNRNGWGRSWSTPESRRSSLKCGRWRRPSGLGRQELC